MATTPFKEATTCNSMSDKVISPLEGIAIVDHSFGVM
jgi:hypothetical protein